MAKKKTAGKKPPTRMPRSLTEAVLLGALSEVTEADIHRFATCVTAPDSVRKRTSQKQRVEQTRSVMILATVGYAFWNWQRDADMASTPPQAGGDTP